MLDFMLASFLLVVIAFATPFVIIIGFGGIVYGLCIIIDVLYVPFRFFAWILGEGRGCGRDQTEATNKHYEKEENN